MRTIEFARVDNFQHIPQTQSNWCWAAVLAEVINTHKGSNYSACEISSQYFLESCCLYGPACNYQNSLYEFHKIVRPFGLSATIYRRIRWESLKEEIRNSRPVLIRVESRLGQGNFLTIVGYDVLINTDTGMVRRNVIISDPMYGYYVGDHDLIGYGRTWEELLQGKLYGYSANWTHPVLFEKFD